MTHDTDSGTRRLSRRHFLSASAVVTATLAGCLDGDGDDDGDDGEATQPDAVENGVPQFPRVEDPPQAVYKPTHRESMVMLPTVEAGEYELLPHFTYPHEFWLVTGTERESVTPTDPGIHLMFAFWDAETGEILPVDAGAEIEIRKDGERVTSPISPWPMLAQGMGFHFGDNVPLREDGTYEVEVTLNPINARKTGEFDGRFEETQTATFQFEYSLDLIQEVTESIEYLDEEEWGERGALDSTVHVDPPGHADDMNDGHGDNGDAHGDGGHNGHGDDHDGHSDDHDGHHGPAMSLPPAEEYPGTDLGTHSSGDAAFVVRYFEQSRLADGSGYLLVSPRTPYNRYPLPDMSLSLQGDYERDLTQTLDSELGHHYGTQVDLSAGDSLELVVNSPPQIARHRGYETAFIEMESMTFEVPE